ncbi:hypothetical protein EIN_398780 [Entamoeba invadens IP1]|uniref:Transmembrane protein n=1 Tax=Entamoeba invadens IP1 TaxID=370355 RepID=A0A0A1UA29_ENTIV|nr:hypothetical protein EIN_398780 [Entamoeba invadens IP1]ELP91908.1 hypothetical protein EIN_398780 [Entamoeba invadens IP1]|eukprot:XP_004258679.1 hypothetical protein EIN_398780 [Entamoeba invadens IP1]
MGEQETTRDSIGRNDRSFAPPLVGPTETVVLVKIIEPNNNKEDDKEKRKEKQNLDSESSESNDLSTPRNFQTMDVSRPFLDQQNEASRTCVLLFAFGFVMPLCWIACGVMYLKSSVRTERLMGYTSFVLFAVVVAAIFVLFVVALLVLGFVIDVF